MYRIIRNLCLLIIMFSTLSSVYAVEWHWYKEADGKYSDRQRPVYVIAGGTDVTDIVSHYTEGLIIGQDVSGSSYKTIWVTNPDYKNSDFPLRHAQKEGLYAGATINDVYTSGSSYINVVFDLQPEMIQELIDGGYVKKSSEDSQETIYKAKYSMTQRVFQGTYVRDLGRYTTVYHPDGDVVYPGFPARNTGKTAPYLKTKSEFLNNAGFFNSFGNYMYPVSWADSTRNTISAYYNNDLYIHVPKPQSKTVIMRNFDVTSGQPEIFMKGTTERIAQLAEGQSLTPAEQSLNLDLSQYAEYEYYGMFISSGPDELTARNNFITAMNSLSTLPSLGKLRETYNATYDTNAKFTYVTFLYKKKTNDKSLIVYYKDVTDGKITTNMPGTTPQVISLKQKTPPEILSIYSLASHAGYKYYGYSIIKNATASGAYSDFRALESLIPGLLESNVRSKISVEYNLYDKFNYIIFYYKAIGGEQNDSSKSVIVNHLDILNNNTSLLMPNTSPERYLIDIKNNTRVNTDKLNLNEAQYANYKYYGKIISEGDTQAIVDSQFSSQTADLASKTAQLIPSDPTTVNYSQAKKFTYVTYLYRPVTVVEELGNQIIELNGRVSYEPQNSFNHTVAIPTSEGLNTAVIEADKYHIGGIKYEETTAEYKAIVKVEKKYDFVYWTRKLDNYCNSCGEYYLTTETPRTAACTNIVIKGWSERTACIASEFGSYCYKYWVAIYGACAHTDYSTSRIDADGTEYRTSTFEYGPINYSYYNLLNLKIFGIDKMNIVDQTSNKGGLLFGQQNQTLEKNTSTSYWSSIFDNISAKTDSAKLKRFSQASGGDKEVDQPVGNINDDIKQSIQFDAGYFDRYPTGTELPDPIRSEVRAISVELTNDTLSFFGKYVLDPVKSIYYVNGENTSGDLDTKDPYTGIYNDSRVKTTFSDYIINYLKIPSNMINGRRDQVGNIFYSVIQDARLNVGANTFKDSIKNVPAIVQNQQREYKDDLVEDIVVHDPITIDYDRKVSGNDVIDHREVKNSLLIQRNAEIIIKPLSNLSHSRYSGKITDYAKYIDKFAVKFEFDLSKVKINGTVKSEFLQRENWIEIPVAGTLTAIVSPTNDDLRLIGNSFSIRALAKNVRGEYNWANNLISTTLNDIFYEKGSQNFSQYTNLYTTPQSDEAKYMAENTYSVASVGRIFDFKITDVLDLDWEKVFRSGNSHTGIVYYSGLKRWDPKTNNDYYESTSSTKFTLPVGPFSHTSPNYTFAPKLGYRFTFDLKTAGKLATQQGRKIVITPKYYFISKDGTTFYDDNQIDLYYKNENNRYIKVGSSNDTYQIKMQPNNAVRYMEAQNIQLLTKDIVSIGNLKEITLNYKNMLLDQPSSGFIQQWYGEFKLPNSTVVLRAGETDLNKALTNGYIGIKFIMQTEEEGNVLLGYEVEDDNSLVATFDTTQWGFENYKVSIPLEYGDNVILKKAGTFIDLSLGWTPIIINRDNYGFDYTTIRGMVIMYDADKRASTDFDIGGTH